MKQEKYDVVVIGAGMGGLSAGAFLAKGGYRTLVVEKLPFIGGRASSIEHKGFQVSTGICAWELGLEDDIYKPLGAPFNVRVPQPNNVYWINGKWHEVPEKGKLRAAITIASGEEEADKIMKALRRALRWNEPSSSISLRDWLLQYTDNEKTLAVVAAWWKIDQVTAQAAIREIKTMGSFSYGYAVSNIGMMESLANVIRSNGGEVRTRCRATRIIVDDGAAKGIVVTTKRGKKETQLDCKVVISDVGPYGTVRLASEENFDKGYIKEMRNAIRTFPYSVVEVVSSEPLVEYPSIGFVVGARVVSWVCTPTMLCPELAPPGKHVTHIGQFVEPNPPWDLEKLLDLAIQDARDFAPKYDKCVEEILHVGFWLRQEWPNYHSYNGHSLPQKTSIENLYNVGDSVFDPGYCGVWGAAISGKSVANDVMSRVKPGEA